VKDKNLYVIIYIFLNWLFMCMASKLCMAEDMKIPVVSKEKRSRVVHQYMQDWAIKNRVGLDTQYFVSTLDEAVQTITSGSNILVQYDKDISDTDNLYDERNTYRFVAQTSGVYYFTATAEIKNIADGKYASLRLVKNNTDVVGNALPGNFIAGPLFLIGGDGNINAFVSGFFYLLEGDFVEVYIQHNDNDAGSETITNDKFTIFQGFRVK